MKKTITLNAMFLLLSSGAFALDDIVVANFEEGSSSLLKDDYGWYDPNLFISQEVSENPDICDVNKTTKCYKVLNVGDSDWWGNFTVLNFETPYLVTEEQPYLKVLMNRSIQPKSFVFDIDSDQNKRIGFGKLKDVNQWEDYVMDLSKYAGQTIEHIRICHSANWDEPRTGWDMAVYLYDEIVFSESSLPRGADVLDHEGFYLSFENQDKESKLATITPQFEENVISYIDNPFKTEFNGTAKVMKFERSENSSWWQGGPNFKFPGLYPMVEGKTFLHFALYLPEITNEQGFMDIQVSAKDHTGRDESTSYQIFEEEAGDWVEVIVDLNEFGMQYITEFTIRIDPRKDDADEWINSPAGTYYIDGVEITTEDERVSLGINNNKITVSDIKVSSTNGEIIVNTSSDADVTVYSVVGSEIANVNVTGNATINVPSGIYVVKTNVNGVVTSYKVCVK